MNLSTRDDVLAKIVAEMRGEYLKSMNTEVAEDSDLRIAYADLTVWFYNRDCQSALSEIKRVWDKVSSNKLGTKSLYFLIRNEFFYTLATSFQEKHVRYMKKLKIAQNFVSHIQKSYLESSQEVNKLLSSVSFEPKDIETEAFLSQSSLTVSKDSFPEDAYFSIEIKINFIEIPDLRNAFCDGFAGYSVEIASMSNVLKTDPVDVEGNRAIYGKSFKM